MPQHGEDHQEMPLLFKKRVLHLATKRGPGANDRKEIYSLSGNHLNWFREKRIKGPLGYKSMIDRRREIGVSW